MKALMLFVVGLLLMGAFAPHIAAAPYSTDITYQGQLDLNGTPYTGQADFKFTLFDSVTAGSAVSSTLARGNVDVSEGVFTVVLDFNPLVFDGTARWLEIEVRTGVVPFEILSPRQELTANPYSLQTRGLTVDDQGNVGVGTNSPATRLHVAKGGSDTAVSIENTSGQSATLYLTTPGLNYRLRVVDGQGLRVTDMTAGAVARLGIDTQGFVGIGTTSPSAPVHLVTDQVNAMIVESSNTTATRLRIRNTAPGGQGFDLVSTADGSPIGGGKFNIRNSNGTVYVQIDDTGHVGIGGDPSATNLLDVAGNVECNVLQINGGSDIAEPFEIASEEPVLPGMVACIDPARPAGLRLSTTPYDRTVAGVVSGAGGINPGMMLHQANTQADGTHPVALTGRVYCYVDADAGGAVQPGDLLTTSPTPGHAMRVQDHERASGAILGKAMTSLESGRGLVLVLVSLQ